MKRIQLKSTHRPSTLLFFLGLTALALGALRMDYFYASRRSLERDAEDANRINRGRVEEAEKKVQKLFREHERWNSSEIPSFLYSAKSPGNRKVPFPETFWDRLRQILSDLADSDYRCSLSAQSRLVRIDRFHDYPGSGRKTVPMPKGGTVDFGFMTYASKRMGPGQIPQGDWQTIFDEETCGRFALLRDRLDDILGAPESLKDLEGFQALADHLTSRFGLEPLEEGTLTVLSVFLANSAGDRLNYPGYPQERSTSPFYDPRSRPWWIARSASGGFAAPNHHLIHSVVGLSCFLTFPYDDIKSPSALVRTVVCEAGVTKADQPSADRVRWALGLDLSFDPVRPRSLADIDLTPLSPGEPKGALDWLQEVDPKRAAGILALLAAGLLLTRRSQRDRYFRLTREGRRYAGDFREQHVLEEKKRQERSFGATLTLPLAKLLPFLKVQGARGHQEEEQQVRQVLAAYEVSPTKSTADRGIEMWRLSEVHVRETILPTLRIRIEETVEEEEVLIEASHGGRPNLDLKFRNLAQEQISPGEHVMEMRGVLERAIIRGDRTVELRDPHGEWQAVPLESKLEQWKIGAFQRFLEGYENLARGRFYFDDGTALLEELYPDNEVRAVVQLRAFTELIRNDPEASSRILHTGEKVERIILCPDRESWRKTLADERCGGPIRRLVESYRQDRIRLFVSFCDELEGALRTYREMTFSLVDQDLVVVTEGIWKQEEHHGTKGSGGGVRIAGYVSWKLADVLFYREIFRAVDAIKAEVEPHELEAAGAAAALVATAGSRES